MRSPEILASETQKRKRRKDSKFKVRKLPPNGVVKDVDDSSSSCSTTTSTSSEAVVYKDICTVSRKSEQQYSRKRRTVAIDCEMVGVGDDKKSALARCSIVNYEGNVIYDTYVKPERTITDFRTQWSGIRSTDMVHAISFRKAKKQAKRLIQGRVLVGHSLQSDLNVLKLKHPYHCLRDTSKYVPLRAMAGLSSEATPSLKNLTRNLLQTEIQTSEHCSVEDARVSMLLYRHCENEWENEWNEMESSSYLCDAYWPSWTKTKM